MSALNPRGISQQGSNAPQGQSVGVRGKGWGLGIRNMNYRGGPWEPTVTYLLLLVVAEVILFCTLRYVFASVHGG